MHRLFAKFANVASTRAGHPVTGAGDAAVEKANKKAKKAANDAAG